jgi:hypothetical protein
VTPVRYSWRRLGASALCLLFASCGTLGSVENRAEVINKLTATYAASAVFFNILRSRNAEPLNFISLTGVTGHDTASLSIGLPTIIIGPGRTSADHLFRFGPNMIGASESDDFNVNRVDDPASYAALSRPADPATIGYFINQFFINRDQIFFLFLSKIQIVDKVGKIIREYYNEPWVFDLDSNRFVLFDGFENGFLKVMKYYLDAGLTASVDQTYVPGGKSTKAMFCFEPNRPDVPQGTGAGNVCTTPDEKNSQGKKLATVSKSSKRAPSGDSGAAEKNVVVQGKIAISGQVQFSTSDRPDTAEINWSFDDPDPSNKGGKVHVYTRSVFAMYRYLGEILNLRESGELDRLRHPALFYPGSIFAGTPQTEMLHVTHDVIGCWSNVDYDGRQWCVPNDALATKRTFAILHQLFELYASPSNQPATPTVRTTPG